MTVVAAELSDELRLCTRKRWRRDGSLTGFLWLATVPPTTGLVATMFGTRYMATLYGVVFLGHQLGSFTGVWLGGWIYERTGNYDAVWWAGIALSLVAVALSRTPGSRIGSGLGLTGIHLFTGILPSGL